MYFCRLYEELTGVNDEIGDLEDRLAALKDKAESLGKKYVQAKKDSEKADREVQVLCCSAAPHSICQVCNRVALRYCWSFIMFSLIVCMIKIFSATA